MSIWTPSDLRSAKAILKQFAPSQYQDALLEVSKQLEKRVTPGSIRAAFQRNHMGPPTSHCKGKVKPKSEIKEIRRSLYGRVHIVIGDSQIKPGVPTKHLEWIGQYIVDQFAGRDVSIIHVGDHWDMPSLSSYDRGKKSMENRRYSSDIKAGNKAFSILCEPLKKYNANRKPEDQWWPDRHFLLGNHEARIARAVETDATLEGTLSYEDFNLKEWGWKVHGFLEPVWLDGVCYSHYFYHPHTGRSYGGDNLALRLKTIGHSFTMGHQQGLNVATRHVGKSRHQGLVVGSTYLHDENYLGPQGNSYWRGIVICHGVENGSYDPMMVSLDYLCRRNEGIPLADYMKKWNEENPKAA